MIKDIYFDRFRGATWPEPRELERFFLAPKGQQWSFLGGNDSWGLSIEGPDVGALVDPRDPHRVRIDLYMTGHPELGVFLTYMKWEGGRGESFSSKGDLSRLKEHVRSLHGTQIPVGLFIPFEEAWKAVKEFIESDGALPKSIAWIDDGKLPPGTFPPP